MEAYPSPGAVVAGRYRIEATLGEGGMGAVFRATELSRNEPVALKFMAPEMRIRPGMESRFATEATAAAKIASEHVVKILGVEATDDGTPFIVMEHLDGTDLDAIITTSAPLDTPRAVHFGLQILRALQVAHAAGIVHRDMKPNNCLVINRDGEPDFLKIIDFGVTKILGDDKGLTKTSTTLGTPSYMSPEQAKSAKFADARSDLYSVGVILYELLTKKRPFDGDSNNDIVIKICTEPPMPIRSQGVELDKRLAAAVEHALVKNATGRYPTAEAFAEALRPFADARSAAVLARIGAGAPVSSFVASQQAQQGQPGSTAVVVARPNHSPAPDPNGPTPVAEPPPDARAPERTVIGEGGPMDFVAPVARPGGTAMMAPPSPAVPYIPGSSGPYSGSPETERSDGGGRGGLFAVLGLVAALLIGGGVYLAFFNNPGSASPPPPSPASTSKTKAASNDDSEDHPSKKKKPKDDTTIVASDPTVTATGTVAPPNVVPTATTKPSTTSSATTKPTTTTTAPTGTATTPPNISDAGPKLILPIPWLPPPSNTGTAQPPATTATPPPTNVAPPPTTTTPPPSTGTTAPTVKKPKFGG